MSYFIFYHKQATSARTLFVSANASVLWPHALPPEARLLDAPTGGCHKDFHGLLAGVDSTLLALETDFCEQVAVGEDLVQVCLVRITSIDPPPLTNAKFIALTEARQLAALELALLRRAYTFIMED
jgi:hypothetical protein